MSLIILLHLKKEKNQIVEFYKEIVEKSRTSKELLAVV